MGTIADGFSSGFRDYANAGDPTSGAHKPIKSDLRALGATIEAVTNTLSSGILSYATKAALDADTSQADNKLAYVTDDATAANNGIYVFTAGSPGSWAKTALQFAESARTISAAGLATGGGSLSEDRTITVSIASEAEAIAGSANDKAMTPLRHLQAINGNPNFGTFDNLGPVFPRLPFSFLVADEREYVEDATGAVYLSSMERRVGSGDDRGELFDRAAYTGFFPDALGGLIEDGAGNVYTRRAVEQSVPTIATYLNASEVYVSSAAGAAPLTDGASAGGDTQYPPSLSDGYLTWARAPAGASYSGVIAPFYLPVEPQISYGKHIQEVHVYFFLGQSQSAGFNNELLAGTAIATDASRIGMLAGGVRVSPTRSTTVSGIPREQYAVEPSQLAGVVPLVEAREGASAAGGTTPAHAFCRELISSKLSNTGLLAINVAIGASALQNLDRGKASFSNLAQALGALALWERTTGIRFVVKGCLLSQGGSNSGDSVALHKGRLEAYYDNLSTLFQAHGYGAHDAAFYVSLMSHEASGSAAALDMNVARAQLEFTEDGVRNVCAVTPEYVLPSVNDEEADPTLSAEDTTHISATGCDWWGGYCAAAVAAHENTAGSWQFLKAATAVRSGTTVTVSYNTAAANITTPLVLGSSHITAVADGDKGFVYSDDGDGNSVSISAVTINGSNQVVITLSAVPTGSNPVVRIGAGETADEANWQGPDYGARCELRDSSTDTISVEGVTKTLYNHAAHQIIPITV